jgi:hypothetical protein
MSRHASIPHFLIVCRARAPFCGLILSAGVWPVSPFARNSIGWNSSGHAAAFLAVDYVHETVKVWFLDCYEWHPVYPKYFPKCAKDEIRKSKFLHAAAVQLKLEGANDFWMKGEATFPISTLLK